MIKQITLVSGETRYQVIAKVQGRYAYLGWYTTEKRAQQALKNAFQ